MADNRIDPRIVNLGIEIDGQTTWYRNYHIEAKGSKVTSAIATNCEIMITGIDTDMRNYILRQTLPRAQNRKQINVTLEVGRESYGASVYYKGSVFRSSETDKPDLGLRLRCLVGYVQKSKIVNHSGGELTSLRQIAKWIAVDNGYQLSFQIPDKNIRSYHYTGSAEKQIRQLEDLADADVFVDAGILYVKNGNEAATGRTVYDINVANRTLIKASPNESGVLIRTMFNPNINIGSIVNLESEINPSLNGRYSLFKVDFDVAKRNRQFYLNVQGAPI